MHRLSDILQPPGARYFSDAQNIPEEGNLVRVEVSGKLTQADYDLLIPCWEETFARHGTMRMLLVMENFQGWEAGAAWDDFHFSFRHADKVEKIAVVGQKAWQKWLMKLGAFLLREDLKYFDSAFGKFRQSAAHSAQVGLMSRNHLR